MSEPNKHRVVCLADESAAPDLLSAAQGALAIIGMLIDICEEVAPPYDDDARHDANHAQSALRAAIAKAEKRGDE